MLPSYFVLIKLSVTKCLFNYDNAIIIIRAQILMQKHTSIFLCVPNRKTRRNPKDLRLKEFYAKVIKAYNGIFESLEHILSFMGITAYFEIIMHISVIFGILGHISLIFLINKKL